MKILLINPPRYNEIIGNNPSLIEEERGCNPPLGILYIAAFLEKHTNHEIVIIDCQVEKIGYNSLGQRIQSINPDIAGITAMTMTLIDVIKTVNLVKKINRNIKVVLGGPHVNLYPEETIRLGNVDYLVLGEGEEVFKDLLTSISDRPALCKIPGLVFQDNGKIVNTGVRPLIKHLDQLPFPARHLTLYQKYTSLLFSGRIVTTIFTSRGCPFKCTFCDRPSLGKIFRYRSALNVVDELEECVSMGIQDFLFYDDTFTVNKKRVIEICNEIIRRKLNITWDIRARVDTVDEQALMHLKKAGCQGIHYGVEAGTERILKILNKGISLKQAEDIFTLTRKYKMQILAYFMIGNPKETLEDIRSTFRIMKRLKPDYVHLTIFTPFPGTEIYSHGLINGDIRTDYWKSFAENPTGSFEPPHWDKIFSKDQLKTLLVMGYRSFYLRPTYILRRVLGLKSFHDLMKKTRAGLKLLKMK